MNETFADVMNEAKNGHASAQYRIAQAYKRAGRYAEALTWFQMAAGQGHATAHNLLGCLYGKGLGTSKDYAVAFYWYKKGAELGDTGSQWNLGISYFYGYGVEKDRATGYMWLTVAINGGLSNLRYRAARFNVGLFLRRCERAEARARAERWVTRIYEPNGLEGDIGGR